MMKNQHILFNLTVNGPTLAQKIKSSAAAAIVSSSSSVGKGGGYGY